MVFLSLTRFTLPLANPSQVPQALSWLDCDHQGTEAAQTLLPAPNAHTPSATVPEGSCSLYNIPSQYLRILATELEEKLLPCINQQLHTRQREQTITMRMIQGSVIFCSLYSSLLACPLIKSILRGKACLSGLLNILRSKRRAARN